MAEYVAVVEAVRLAEKRTELLREVMKKRAEGATLTTQRTAPSPQKLEITKPKK